MWDGLQVASLCPRREKAIHHEIAFRDDGFEVFRPVGEISPIIGHALDDASKAGSIITGPIVKDEAGGINAAAPP